MMPPVVVTFSKLLLHKASEEQFIYTDIHKPLKDFIVLYVSPLNTVLYSSFKQGAFMSLRIKLINMNIEVGYNVYDSKPVHYEL